MTEGESGTFEFTVKNKGPEFNQALCIVIGQTIFWAEGVYLQDGESKTVRMTGLVTQSAGEHTAYVAAYSMSLGGISTLKKKLPIYKYLTYQGKQFYQINRYNPVILK